jgi:hypothetical protein
MSRRTRSLYHSLVLLEALAATVAALLGYYWPALLFAGVFGVSVVATLIEVIRDRPMQCDDVVDSD